MEKLGGAKGVELAKIARRDRQQLDRANWLHKARGIPKKGFQQVVERELTGMAIEPGELFISSSTRDSGGVRRYAAGSAPINGDCVRGARAVRTDLGLVVNGGWSDHP